MSDARDEEDGDPRPPRETAMLFGHAEAERTLLDAYRSTRIPHAWLIGGPHGVGKATLAYRMARFVLAHPDPAAPVVQQATSLAVAPEHVVARRMAAQGQPDLLVLERTINEKTGKLRQDIQVDDVRRSVAFFGSTAREGGWRVAVIDSADELNPSGANALLKVLEEPPARALLLIVSDAPGRLLPTIRSRCRRLTLKPLDAADVARAVAATTGRNENEPLLAAAAAAAEGSVSRALSLLDGKALALRQRVLDLLAALPALDRARLHGLGDALSGAEAEPLAIVIDAINAWMSERVGAVTDAPARARLAAAWEKINDAARDAEEYNLERRPLVFSVFGWLAEAVHG